MYCQFQYIVALRPWTSTTGSGCAALGLHAKLFAPGGGGSYGGAACALAAPHAAASRIVIETRERRTGSVYPTCGAPNHCEGGGAARAAPPIRSRARG